MKWIKVEDALPESARMVLCYMPCSHSGYKGIHYGWRNIEVDYKGEPNGWAWRAHSPHAYAHRMEDENHTGCKGSKVTHWMALEPPRAAAQALGVPLAPEPKEEAAKEWPEWWGDGLDRGRLFRDTERLDLVKLTSSDLLALVAAYEAARKAGCLPGLEDKEGVWDRLVGSSPLQSLVDAQEPRGPQGPDNPWLNQVTVNETRAYRDYQAHRNQQMADLGMHFAEPSDRELAQRARAAEAALLPPALMDAHPNHHAWKHAAHLALEILRGQQPASGREGE